MIRNTFEEKWPARYFILGSVNKKMLHHKSYNIKILNFLYLKIHFIWL